MKIITQANWFSRSCHGKGYPSHILSLMEIPKEPANSNSERYNISMVKRLIPIYATCGDLGAYLYYPYLYNTLGEWIGFVTPKRQVFSVLGHYVGTITNEPRILRRRSYDFSIPRRTPPPPQPRISVPASVPLAPMMAELSFSMIDVLEDEPERLSTIDFDDLREDMD